MKNNTLSIRLDNEPAYQDIVRDFVSGGIRTFGFEEDICVKFAETAKAFFLHLHDPSVSYPVNISLKDNIVRAEISFHCESPEFPNHKFSFSPCEDDLIEGLNFVDFFDILENGGTSLDIILAKNKFYEDFVPYRKTLPISSNAEITVGECSLDSLLALMKMLVSTPDELEYMPIFLCTPARTVDLVRSGEMNAIVAFAGKLPCAVLFWDKVHGSTINSYGPYCLPGADRQGAGRILQETLFGKAHTEKCTLAITNAIPPTRAKGVYEQIGDLKIIPTFPSFFREIIEDSGAVLFTTDMISDYVRAETARLCLPRIFMPCPKKEVQDSPTAVLNLCLRRNISTAILRQSTYGEDACEALKKQCHFISKLNYDNIGFMVDIGTRDGALFAEAALRAGLKPTVYLPSGGVADIIFFFIATNEI